MPPLSFCESWQVSDLAIGNAVSGHGHYVIVGTSSILAVAPVWVIDLRGSAEKLGELKA